MESPAIIGTAATAGGARLGGRVRVLSALFFLSGFPALIYQLTWQRELFLIFGVNIESVTIVVTAFMLGLGLGSLAGGWLSKRRSVPPLAALAAIELATSAFGFVSLPLFAKVGQFTIGLSLPVTAITALALVIVPTFLMGATLPMLVGYLARRSGQIGGSVGLLYYVNTLGAGAACLVSALLLFPFIGMSGSITIAAAMNIAVGFGALIAWRIDREAPDAAVVQQDKASRRDVAVLKPAAAWPLAAAGGFVSLSCEIFFFRTMSYASGSSATTFAIILSAFLVGIASGARHAGEICERAQPRKTMDTLAGALLKASAFGVVFLPLLNHLNWLQSGLTGVAMAMVFLVARYWGMVLPLVAELSIPADDKAGMRTATLYLANILGAASGSVVTGFVLMNLLTLVQTAVLLAALAVVCALAAVAALPFAAEHKRRYAAAGVALALLASFAVPYGSARVLENLQWKGAPDARTIVRAVENRSGIITVMEGGVVYGNGMYDGRFNTDLAHDINGIVRPYALSLFHPAPRHVLMIGLASGSWAKVIANNPNVETLTIVEINPGYADLIRSTDEVASVLRNSKVTLVTDDGRRWLRANPGRRFDAIVSNTTWYFRASVSNLLSADFLSIVRQHLEPGGVFFYNTTDSGRVQRTACLTFPHGARFTNHIVVSDRPIAWDFDRWRRTLESYRIDGRRLIDPADAGDRKRIDEIMAWKSGLAPEASDDPKRPIEPCSAILARTAGMMPVTDDNMGSEWRAFMGFE